MSVALTYDDPRRRVLEQLADAQRGAFTNLALRFIRGGLEDPVRIGDAMFREFDRHRDRAAEQGDMGALIIAEHGADLVVAEGDAVEALIAWLLDYERLPRAERERLKAARGERHRRQWLDQQPASEKQIAYCRSLGYAGTIESKAHASEIIDHLKPRRAS